MPPPRPSPELRVLAGCALLAACATTAAQQPAPPQSAPASPPADAAVDGTADAAQQPAAPAASTTATDASASPQLLACPPDPEAEQQAALAPTEDGTRWPAEVRLRIRVRADGTIDCVRPIGASHPDFIDDCERQLEGRKHRPQRDRDGAPVDGWLTYMCEFEPKR